MKEQTFQEYCNRVRQLEKQVKALEQELRPMEKFESAKDHIYKLAGDYKCWDNRLTDDEALELYHILEQEPCEDVVNRKEVVELAEFVQSIKDEYQDNKEVLNYGTLCDIVIKAWKIANLPSVTSESEQEPCKDVISRQAVKNKYRESLIDTLIDDDRGIDLSDFAEKPYEAFCKFIDSIPSVTPQPKTGHWYRKHSWEICFTCSNCETTNASGTKYNYCPSCGARMESEDKE